jgi:hypothetical protein
MVRCFRPVINSGVVGEERLSAKSVAQVGKPT